MKNWCGRHPFLLIGALTIGLFGAAELLNRAGATEAARVLMGPMRWWVLPMYVAWLPLMMLQVALVGPEGGPGLVKTAFWVVSLGAGLLPYMFADHLLGRWLRRPPDTGLFHSDVAAKPD